MGVGLTGSVLMTYEDSLSIDNDPSLVCSRWWAEGHDVPNHGQADLETLRQTLACALRLAYAAAKSDGYLDD